MVSYDSVVGYIALALGRETERERQRRSLSGVVRRRASLRLVFC